jgi:hypothetical protein
MGVIPLIVNSYFLHDRLNALNNLIWKKGKKIVSQGWAHS